MSSFRNFLGSPWGALSLLLAINLLNYIDRYLPSAVLSSISKQLFPADQKSDTLEGSLQSAFMFSFMITAPLFGWLCRHFNRWHIIGVGVILWSIASGASGLAGLAKDHVNNGAGGIWVLVGTFAFLFMSRCFVGVGEAAYGPAAPAILSDLFVESKRGMALSFFYAAIPVGSAFGYLVGGMLGWPNAFFWMLPPGLLLGFVCFFAPETAAKSQAHHSAAKKSRVWELAKIPSYVLAVAGYTLSTFAIGAIAFWLPKYLITHREVGNEASVNTMVGGIIALSGLLATLIGGWLADWFKKKRPGAYFEVSSVGLLLSIPFLLLTLYCPFPLGWVMIFGCTFCMMLNTGPINAIVMNVVPPDLRPQAMAMCIFCIHALGDAISPPLVGLANDLAGNPNAGFLSLTVLLFAGAVVWWIGAKTLKVDLANEHKTELAQG